MYGTWSLGECYSKHRVHAEVHGLNIHAIYGQICMQVTANTKEGVDSAQYTHTGMAGTLGASHIRRTL